MQEPNKKEPTPNRLNRFTRNASFWALIVITAFLITRVFSPQSQQTTELTYTPEFVRQIDAENIDSLTVIDGKRLEGWLRRPVTVEDRQYTEFWTLLPIRDSEQIMAQLRESGIPIRGADPKQNLWIMVLQFLPWILIIALWVFMLRGMQAGGSKAFQFGKSKARLLTGDTPKVTFVDV